MKQDQMAKAFNPAEFEDRIYRMWLEADAFAPSENDSDKPPFVMVIPPPNVTGVLHMGHGLNCVFQDILARYHRMNGRPTLWLPGTDHAGIATQNIVEKKLKQAGKTRADLGRQGFLEAAWKVKQDHHAIITRQLRRLGASCDWRRERFTMDAGCSKAVREIFVSLHEKGLIYQGDYLINWCANCGTALADDEVERQDSSGKLYYARYPLSSGRGFLTIATTRPETIPADTAVAVHPLDERYRELIGQTVDLPLTERKIAIIADEYVDREFGSGALKVTPGHDPNDWDIGERHRLERLSLFTPEGLVGEAGPQKYQGLSIKEAKKAMLADLRAADLLIKEEDINHATPHCYRCRGIIEPRVSRQWFVATRKLADQALVAWQDGQVVFFPEKWENTYRHWLTHIRDWCISRQLWWGHRLPVWYCDTCGEVMVCRVDPESCQNCGSSLRQDEDVLDTWFSSWLWPFSTLGWPEKTADLDRFFPTSALVTGYDIIFFWVARMIMVSLEFLDQVPFRDIFITGLVRDKKGRKMSKSLGNGIDPLEIVDLYGADALKFTLSYMAAQGQDCLIDRDSFKLGSKFANKLWNAARYLLLNLTDRRLLPETEIEHQAIDKWLSHRLNQTVGQVRQAMAGYRFNEAAQAVYDFFWNDFCDWYIEAGKPVWQSEDEAEKDRVASLMCLFLEEILRLAHPFLSFLTEEIYQKLPIKPYPLLITAPYPTVDEKRNFQQTASLFSLLQSLVRGIRTVRSEFTINPKVKLPVKVRCDQQSKACRFLTEHRQMIIDLSGCQSLLITVEAVDTAGSVPVAGKGFAAFVYIDQAIDLPREITRLKKEKTQLDEQLRRLNGKLANQDFNRRAPAAIIEKEKARQKELSERQVKINDHLRILEK